MPPAVVSAEPSPTAAPSRLPAFVLGAMAIYFAVLVVRSLGWHLYQDAPVMLYAAFLIDRLGFVPYRDFFDMNLPGTYAANVIVGRLSGYSELGVRAVDLALLGVLLAMTFQVMGRFGARVAWCAVLFFGVLYVASGEWMSLQREFLMLLPVAAALSLACPRRPLSWPAAFAIGVSVGVAATIRLDAALLLPIMLVFAGSGAAAAIGGFVVPIAGTAFYLWRHAALGAFVDIARHYWPLYAALSGSPRPHVILSGARRAAHIAAHALTFGPHPGLPLVIAAAIGTYTAVRRSALPAAARRVVWLLAALTAYCWLHVAIAGKFWLYHWLPFNYFAILLGSLALVDQRADAAPRPRLVPLALALLLVGLPWRYGPFRERNRFAFADVDAIASYLARLGPGDTVAPLDWTEGAVHAMLRARATLGTPFLYDFHFYHHVSSPYIQELRRRMLASLDQSRPRVIVRIDRPGRFAGPDTSQTFDDLTRFISAHYDKAVVTGRYEIWERR